MIKTQHWNDMLHMNDTAIEIMRFNHQLANLNLHGENALVHMLMVAICDTVQMWNSVRKT